MVKCSFCGKEFEEEMVVMGVNTAICGDCLILGLEMLPDTYSGDSITHPKPSTPPNQTVETPKEICLKPHEMKEKLDEYVIGQEDAKRLLVTEIYAHLKNVSNETPRRKNNICMVGPSGCGKTYLIEQLAKLLDIPFILEDATSFTKTGYVGSSVSSLVERLYHAANGNLEKAQRGIIFIDEIDKLSMHFNTSSGKGDVGTSGVQQELLKMMEGSKIELSVDQYFSQKTVLFDTRNVLFIVGGAFVGLNEDKERKAKKQGRVGFQCETEVSQPMTSHTTHEDLVHYKLMPELVGRLSLILDLKALTETELRSVLLDSKESVLLSYQTLFKQEGIELTFSDEAIDYLVQEAKKSPIGVRGLSGNLSKTLNNLLYHCLSTDEPTTSIIIRDEDLKKVTLS